MRTLKAALAAYDVAAFGGREDDGRPLHEQAHDALATAASREKGPGSAARKRLIRRTAVALYEAWCDFLSRAGNDVLPGSPLPPEWHAESVQASTPKAKRKGRAR